MRPQLEYPNGVLGEKLGEGAFSDVHAWAAGQVVKLFRADIPRRIPWWEARMTQAVFGAGGPAPEVLGKVTLDGRRGIVLPRLDGPTLSQQLRDEAITIGEAGAVLAALTFAVQATPTPPDVVAVRDYMEDSLQLPEAAIPEPIATGVLALIDSLPVDDRLSHCDIHPSNVIMTAQGPKLIDWTGVKRGGPVLDLAFSRFLRTELVVETLGPPERQRALDDAVQTAYARLAGIGRAELAVAVEAQLPIVRVFFLLGGVARPATRARLLRRLEADLGLDACPRCT